MFYTIYKISNLIDGKIYIGSHKTKDLNDDYMGSGKYLKRAIEKYGLENFKKEILFVFDNPEDMYAKEAEIVNEDFLAEENTYNLKLGGFGGWDYINTNEEIIRKRDSYENKLAGRIAANKVLQNKFISNEEYRKSICAKISSSLKEYFAKNNLKCKPGRKHTKESKEKIGAKNAINQLGNRNSQYGKRWIYNLELKLSKTIPKEDPLPEGWQEGRKIKF